MDFRVHLKIIMQGYYQLLQHQYIEEDVRDDGVVLFQ